MRRSWGIRWRRRLLLTPALTVVGMGVSYLIYLSLAPAEFDREIINTRFLTQRLVSHVELVLEAFAVAALVGVPCGVWLARAGRPLRALVFLVANLGQALPSIGVLVLFETMLGLGSGPAVIALALYGLLPVMRNAMVGVLGVDPAVREAARGIGMSPWQSLVRVELPLASPVIFAGLRTALVLVVGTATLGNFVGARSLGDVIAAGINYSDRIVFVGAVMVAALALTADWLLGLVEWWVVPQTATS